MAGFRIPGPQRNADPSINDGTLTRAKSPTPGHVDATKNDANDPVKKDVPSTEQIRQPVCVFFFGGFRSIDSDISKWTASAQKQRGNVMFHGFPYPPHTSSEPSASVLSKFGPALAAIKDSLAEKIYIVGHSSGCAIANLVARRFMKNPKMTLVALDGFLPDAELLKLPNTRVWGAVGGKEGKSLHHDGMESGGGDKFREFTAHDDCSTKLALHFSLVNVNANDKELRDLKGFPDIPNGYKGCDANLCWL